MAARRTGLSIAVITLNEADRLGVLLDSVGFADEVVVVDSGSTDGTAALAEERGARVIHNPWPGYAAQKQLALAACNEPWVLSLDADEAVSPALVREIQSLLAGPEPECAAYAMPRLSRYLGRWIRHGGWYPDRKVRLVRPEAARWSDDGLHEKLEVEGRIGRLEGDILHHVYRDMADQVATINRFSATAAREKTGAGVGWLAAGVVHCAGKFLECYLWKRGFLDGAPGLVIAMNSAWYVFLKHAKAWERARATNDGYDL